MHILLHFSNMITFHILTDAIFMRSDIFQLKSPMREDMGQPRNKLKELTLKLATR